MEEIKSICHTADKKVWLAIKCKGNIEDGLTGFFMGLPSKFEH